VLNLAQLFKIFIDPEDDKIRLIFQEGERLVTVDLSPEKYILFIENLMQDLSKLGRGLE
jgi:hypothetical protein